MEPVYPVTGSHWFIFNFNFICVCVCVWVCGCNVLSSLLLRGNFTVCFYFFSHIFFTCAFDLTFWKHCGFPGYFLLPSKFACRQVGCEWLYQDYCDCSIAFTFLLTFWLVCQSIAWLIEDLRFKFAKIWVSTIYLMTDISTASDKKQGYLFFLTFCSVLFFTISPNMEELLKWWNWGNEINPIFINLCVFGNFLSKILKCWEICIRSKVLA